MYPYTEAMAVHIGQQITHVRAQLGSHVLLEGGVESDGHLPYRRLD